MDHSREGACNQIWGARWGEILICPFFVWTGGHINDPSALKHFALPFLPSNPQSQSMTLKGLIELTKCPSWAPNLALGMAFGYTLKIICKDTVRCGLDREVPGECQET